MDNNYKVGTPIYVNETGMLYPISHISSARYNCAILYKDTLKKRECIPDFLEFGRNILNLTDWEKFAAERESFVDENCSRLNFNIYEGTDVLDSSEFDFKKSIIQLQMTNPDIIVVENFAGVGDDYDLVAIKSYDPAYTNLSFKPRQVNMVPKMHFYEYDLLNLLNSSFEILLDKNMREKYPFIKITEISPEMAAEELSGSGRTIFGMRKNPTVQDYFSAERKKK